ncbi:metal-dependent protease of the PAD1/JAB1 superfamily [Methanosarcinales archaeon]|uniref:JAB domain-containing protein n=1 Tax=Candidatus Syntropharchaeum caldarium TaxID=1838285 RepID=A0A1F2P7W5_9EURY|nr:MAG: hypothetical protein SCAL_001328 [Candidatus Syntrophoarchaeum caldarius]RLG35520.1 MAG: metal-dependent protease of the PAD1/JAB1 superfamily [Methanosarcinales archaeon]
MSTEAIYVAKKTEIKGIARDTLEFILNASKSSHPEEFAGLLEEVDGVITNVILLPGTISSSMGARIQFDMMPLHLSSVGSVHSHPTPNNHPSKADLHFFARKGDYHIIVGYPYSNESWACYNAKGEERNLKVLDLVPDPSSESDTIW